MSDRSNHLIERAAALLKAANVSQGLPPRADELGGSEIPAPPHREAVAGARPPGRKQVSLAAPPSFIPTADALRAPTKLGRTVSELRRESKQPALSIGALERAGLMVARMNRTRTTEEYRIVIGRVLRALHDGQEAEVSLGSTAPSNVVMVTSARPGEGKSFTSLNLGGSIAQNAGESVLIVDVDAKNNSMTDMLGLSDRKGFLDLVADPDLSPDDLIIPSDIANLSFLALGSRSAVRESAEGGGIEERRLTPPILKLAKRFPQSLILLDAPPCLSTSDPHTLSPAVGQVVVVVEAERTQRSEVEAAIEMVKVCPTITMLLNKVRMSSNHTFGTYDYFGSYT